MVLGLEAFDQRCSVKKVFLGKVFTGKHLCQRRFLNKVPGRVKLYLKRDSGTGVFLELL